MTKIQRVVKDIQNLQDFYKRTESMRAGIQKKELDRLKDKHAISDNEMKAASEVFTVRSFAA